MTEIERTTLGCSLTHEGLHSFLSFLMKQGLNWSWCKCVEQHSTEAAGRGESVSADVTLMAAEDGWTMCLQLL